MVKIDGEILVILICSLQVAWGVFVRDFTESGVGWLAALQVIFAVTVLLRWPQLKGVALWHIFLAGDTVAQDATTRRGLLAMTAAWHLAAHAIWSLVLLWGLSSNKGTSKLLSWKGFALTEVVVVSHLLLYHLLAFVADARLGARTPREKALRVEETLFLFPIAFCMTLRWVQLPLRDPWRSVAFHSYCSGFICLFIYPILYAAVGREPLHWVGHYLVRQRRGVFFCQYWLIILFLYVAAMASPAGRRFQQKFPHTVVRKFFHFLAVALFAPALLSEPQFLGLALAGALAILILLESIRYHKVWGCGPIDAFMAPFTDSRDQGGPFKTHLYLLLGCSLPVWYCNRLPATSPPSSRTALPVVLPFAGLLVVGVGDAAASLCGRYLGTTKWQTVLRPIGVVVADPCKSVEGTVGATLCVVVCGTVLQLWLEKGGASHAWSGPALAMACAYEAVTTDIDNLTIPVLLMAILASLW